MSWDGRKKIPEGQEVKMRLSGRVVKLILEETLADMCDDAVVKELQAHVDGGVLSMTLDDWEELHGYIAEAANHEKSKNTQKALDTVFAKIQSEVFVTGQCEVLGLFSAVENRGARLSADSTIVVASVANLVGKVLTE
jgi:hypothetical protein